MGHGALARDAAALLADDDGKLAFPVEPLALLGLQHRLLVADLGVGETREDRRVRRIGAARLGAVLAVVHARAENAQRVRDDRHPGELAVLDVGLAALGVGLELRQAAAEQRHAQGRPLLAEFLAEIDEAAGDDRAVGFLLADTHARELHMRSSFPG